MNKPIAILLIAALVATIALPTSANDDWPAVRDQLLEVVEGSALDFTAFRPSEVAGSRGWVQADRDGRFRFSGASQPQRFQCASLVLASPNGGMPSKADADRFVAQLVRAGYNLARLHYFDAIAMTGRREDFGFDPEILDRIHYLMAKMKAAGIYWIADGMTSENGAIGNVASNRFVNQHNLKERIYYDPKALEHWKRLVTQLWATVNPYTGIAPLADPAMVGVIAVNEGSLAYLSTLKGRYPPELREKFASWVAARYKDEAGFRAAWGREVADSDKFGVAVEVPNEIRAKSVRGRDFSLFVADLERALFREMDAHLKARGFRGMTTAYDNWGFFHADVSRSEAAWVDMHAYQSLPTKFVAPGSVVPQKSIFDDFGRFGRELTNARQWGKPFSVTEYGQPFWNQWRHETAVWIPAFAAFQGWDAICQFSDLPVLTAYSDTQAPRRRAIHPFTIGGDPITRAGERLAALLFLRGDVSVSRKRVFFQIDPEKVLLEGAAFGQIPEAISRLAMVVGAGLAFPGSALETTPGADIRFPVGTHSATILDKGKAIALDRGLLMDADPVARLRSAGMLAPTNRTQLSSGIFETDTGEMLFDARAKRLLLNTPKSVAFVLRDGSAQAGAVELSALSGPATVAISSIDAASIGESQRLLVWVLTDALNSGMEFSDADKATLAKLGEFPPRVRPVSGRLAIRSKHAAGLKVWAIDQSGRRVASVPVTVSQDRMTAGFSIANTGSGFGPVVHFEVALR